MKKFTSLSVCLLLTLLAFALSACDTEKDASFHEHQWIEATCTLPKQCMTCNEVVGTALGHVGGIATCSSKAICTTCGESYGDFSPHYYSEEIITDEYLASQATCQNSAHYYKSCSCGEKGTQTFAYGSALEHAVVIDAAKSATCISTGSTEGSHCSMCGTVLIRQNVVPKSNTHTESYGTCVDCNTICNAYDALAYYVLCNGSPDDAGEEYSIMNRYVYNQSEYYYFIYTDINASALSFRMLGYVSNVELFVTMDLTYNSNIQEVYMGCKSLGYTDYTYGKIYSNTFSSSNMYVFDYIYQGNFPSLSSNYKTTFAEEINLMLTGIDRLILTDIDIGITMPMLGFDNY